MDLLSECYNYVVLLESSDILKKKEDDYWIAVDRLTQEQLTKMNNYLSSEGYDVRGPEDIKKLFKKHIFIQGEHDEKFYKVYDSWLDTVKKVIGFKVEAPAKIKDLLKIVIKNIAKEKESGVSIVDFIGPTCAYILPDGRCIKFPGGSRRGDDHRIIGSFIPEEFKKDKSLSEVMEMFLKDTGTIRFIPEQTGFDIKERPTTKQYAQIKSAVSHSNSEVALDLWSPEYPKFGKVYKKGVDPKIIYRDIESYYLTGKVRDTSFFED